MNFAVKINKGDEDEAGNFIGQKVIREIAEKGPAQKLVGLVLRGKRTPRQDMKVLCNGVEVGAVTSGCSSPTLEKPIAMAYVKAEHAEIGTSLQIDLGKAYLLLVGADGGRVNRDVLEFVAEPVEISGEVVRAGDQLILYADPATYRLVGR